MTRFLSTERLVVAGAFTALAFAMGPTGGSAQGGGQSSANMQVNANVIRKCTISAQPLAFGSYDPVQTNAAAPLDGQTTLTVACTKGTAISIGMDAGTNAQGTVRRMTSGAGE